MRKLSSQQLRILFKRHMRPNYLHWGRDRGSERAGDRASDRGLDRSSDLAAERFGDRVTEQSLARSLIRSLDRRFKLSMFRPLRSSFARPPEVVFPFIQLRFEITCLRVCVFLHMYV